MTGQGCAEKLRIRGEERERNQDVGLVGYRKTQARVCNKNTTYSFIPVAFCASVLSHVIKSHIADDGQWFVILTF